nr:MFS transporter [Sporichthya polymorpha]
MSQEAPAAPAAPPASRPVDEFGYEQRSHREILLVMSGLMIAMMLAMLDNMIVAPALPTIVGELGGLEHLAWVTTAYILGVAVATPVWGKLMDLFDRKLIFVGSIVMFLVGSALCGMAQSMTELILFRAFQGLGAGGLIVGVMAVMAVIVPPRERGKYAGYFMAIMPVSMIAGPLIGGWITDHASWRWAFYVNVPVGGLALFVVMATMHLPKPPKKKVSIDWWGTGLMVTWVTAIILVTSWGGTEYGWGSPTILGLVAVSVIGFVAFLGVERRAAEPVLPLGVFRNSNFTYVAVLSFAVGFVMFGGMTFLPQFQQYVQGQSATNSGLLLMPMMVGSLFTSVTSGQLITKTGSYRIYPILGTVAMAVGLALMATMGTGTGEVETGIYMFIMGSGMGLLFQSTMLIAQNSVEMKDIGAATATATFVRSMGGSLGVSALGAIYAHQLTGTITDRLGPNNPVGDGTELSPEVVRTMPEQVVDAIQHGIVDGLSPVFVVSAILAALAIPAALAIKHVPLRGGPGSAPAPAAPAAPAPVSPETMSKATAAATEASTLTVRPVGPGLVVRGVDGAPVPGASVTLLSRSGRELEVGTADETGSYLPSAAGAEAYAVIASAPGYAPHAGRIAPPNGVAQKVVLTPLGAEQPVGQTVS